MDNLEAPTIDKNSLIPDLTLAVALGDFDKDGDLDVIAGNLGQPNRLYLNDGKGNFSAGIDIGVGTLNVSIDPAQTQTNVSVNDLVHELQTQIDNQLAPSGFFPGTVQVAIDPATGQIVLTSASRVLDATSAESAINAARRDGLIVTNAANDPLPLAVLFDGHDIHFSIKPNDADTLDNVTADDLRDELQRLVDQAVVASGFGAAGDIKLQIDGTGRMIFTTAGHTLISAEAEAQLAQARRAGDLVTAGAHPWSSLWAFRTQIKRHRSLWSTSIMTETSIWSLVT